MRGRRWRAKVAALCPTHRRKDSCACTALTRALPADAPAGQSDAGRAGIFLGRTNRKQAAHRRTLMTDQSDAGRAQAYSHDGPIGRRPRTGVFS
eukprot:9487197-Pyramimonas_sp.AAC.2